MIVNCSYPPNYSKIIKAFPHVQANAFAIFCYGTTIYSPHSEHVPEDLIVHESTHRDQQSKFNSPEEWWDLYLSDQSFRLSQEIEAYRNQYRFAKSQLQDRNQTARFLHLLSIALSSSLYGKMISYSDAKKELMK